MQIVRFEFVIRYSVSTQCPITVVPIIRADVVEQRSHARPPSLTVDDDQVEAQTPSHLDRGSALASILHRLSLDIIGSRKPVLHVNASFKPHQHHQDKHVHDGWSTWCKITTQLFVPRKCLELRGVNRNTKILLLAPSARGLSARKKGRRTRSCSKSEDF